MAINYIQGTEDVPVLYGNYDEGDHWWGGVQNCFASVALAAVLAVTALSTQQAQAVATGHQDDPAGNLTATVDEYFWQNPTPPVVGSLYQNLPYLPDPEEIPAGSLHAPPDEVFWANPVAPDPGALLWPQQWTFDEQTPVLNGQFDEDFWANPAAPVAASLYQPLPYLPDPEEIPAGTLHAQFDEDFWPAQLLPPPVPASLGALYLPDPEEIPAGNLYVPVEEYWQNPVAPVPLSLWQPLPYFFDDAAFITTVIFIPDEDFFVPLMLWPDDAAISLW